MKLFHTAMAASTERPSSFRLPSLGALLLLVSACASYPERTDTALRDFERGHMSNAIDAFQDVRTTGSEFLSGVEAGTVALAAGEWDVAIEQLGRAHYVVEDAERSALISPESLGDTLLSWTLNESQQTYYGEGFERVQLHVGLALAYLAKGDLEGARVEVRLSNQLLESEEKLYSKEYRAGGLGHLLSAITYELANEPDEAYIDYERMEQKGVGTEIAGRALVRLAKRLHRDDARDMWIEKYGDSAEMPASHASIVLVAAVGLGAYKREILLPIPTPDGLLQWAVPTYESHPQPISYLELRVQDSDPSVRTALLENVAQVAKENLDDRIAWLATKSAVRAVIKRELTQQLEEQAGGWGRLLGDLFTFVTERADLRCWRTLPDTWQAARAFLPAGKHEISVAADSGQVATLGTFELEPGETMFVFVRTAGTQLHVHPIGGRRVDTSDAPSDPSAEASLDANPKESP
jgi:hypothetical protein